MKQYTLLFLLAFTVLFISGCDLNTLPLNVPVSVELSLGPTSANSFQDDGTVNLADYEDLINDNVNKVTFIEAAFRVKTVSDPNLTGNITVSLTNNAGFNYSQTFTNVKPSTYITTPYVLSLTADQIQTLNTYLANTTNKVFTGSVSVSNVTGTAPHSMTAVIDVVFEAETEL